MKKTFIVALLPLVLLGIWLMRPSREPNVAHLSGRREPPRMRASWFGGRDDRAARISGRVQTPDGTGVTRARVCAGCASCEPITAPAHPCVEADAEGNYQFAMLTPSSYVLTGSASSMASGRAAGGQPITLSAGQHCTGVNIVLQHGGAQLDGVVTDALGGPIGGATVRAIPEDAIYGAVDVVTDDDGRFSLWMAPGPVAVSAKAKGYSRTETYSVLPTHHLRLVLSPGSTLRGRVLSAKDGSGVAAVSVEALTVGSGIGNAPHGSTDDKGEFAIEGLEPGLYTLTARGAHMQGTYSTLVELRLGETISDIVIPVAAAFQVTGRVLRGTTDEACLPGFATLGPPERGVTQAHPTESQQTLEVPTRIARIDADGTVRFDGMVAGRYYVSVQCNDNVLKEGPLTVEVHRSDIHDLVWRAEPGLGFTLTVVDSARSPVPGAGFALIIPPRADGDRGSMTPLTTGPDGRYRFPRVLEPGRYAVEPAVGYSGEPVVFELVRTDEQREVTLALGGSGRVLVSVSDSAATAIDGLTVSAVAERSARHAEIEADPKQPPSDQAPTRFAAAPKGEGRYQIAPIPAGRYEVQVDDGINPTLRRTGISVGERATAHAELVFERAEALIGQVVDSDGNPASDVWVSAVCAQSDCDSEEHTTGAVIRRLRGSGPRILSDASGQFRLEGLRRGVRYSVHAHQLYGAGTVMHDVVAGRSPVKIVLPSMVALEGTASDRQGTPVSQFALQVQHIETGNTRWGEVDAQDGRWRFERIIPGRVRLIAVDQTGRNALATLEVSAGLPSTPVQLTFEAAPREQMELTRQD